MAVLRALNTALSFLLELAMLAAFAYGGFQAAANPWLKWALAIGLPLVVIILWALFLAPKAGRRAGATAGVLASTGLFCAAALALLTTGQPVLGVIMLLVATVNRTLVVVWKQW